MNIDRLLKLLKLANHNPNDAEANSAARAAAKLLGENNYKWLEDAKRINPRTAADKVNQGARTWQDVKRSEEPQWRSTREPQRPRGQYYERANRDPFGFGDDPGEDTGFNWEEFFRKEQERQDKTREHRRRQWQEKQATNWTWTAEETESKKGYKKVYKQVCRDCTVCKVTRLTTDEETPYVCYECKRKV